MEFQNSVKADWCAIEHSLILMGWGDHSVCSGRKPKGYGKPSFTVFELPNSPKRPGRVGVNMGDELVNQAIGDKIFKMRKMLGFTQEELGQILNVSYQQVQKYESGMNAVSPAKLIQLARLFRCSIDYLCNFEMLAEVSAVVDDADFLDRGDFKKTQALIRHFINIESPELRNVVYNMVKRIATLNTHL